MVHLVVTPRSAPWVEGNAAPCFWFAPIFHHHACRIGFGCETFGASIETFGGQTSCNVLWHFRRMSGSLSSRKQLSLPQGRTIESSEQDIYLGAFFGLDLAAGASSAG